MNMPLESRAVRHKDFQVLAIPLFTDNYAWLIHDGSHAWIVDPGDAVPIMSVLNKLDLKLAGMLVTHSHWDHVNGIEALLANHSVPVYGYEDVHPRITHAVKERDRISLNDLEIEVLYTPGHLADHVTYYAHEPQWAFCGDTLFSGGCGRVKQTGNIAELEASIKRLGTLPTSTILFCSHEYTLSNLAFAKAVEPNNQAIDERIKFIQKQLAQGLASLPCILEDELLYNPFLRLDQKNIQSSIDSYSGQKLTHSSHFAALRRWKDVF